MCLIGLAQYSREYANCMESAELPGENIAGDIWPDILSTASFSSWILARNCAMVFDSSFDVDEPTLLDSSVATGLDPCGVLGESPVSVNCTGSVPGGGIGARCISRWVAC